MKIFLVYILVLFIYGTNCYSQTRISTNDKNYLGFIINENKSYLFLKNIHKQKVMIEKSHIIERKAVIVLLELNTITLTGNVQKIRDDEFEMITSDSVLVKIKINTIVNCRSDDSEVEQLLNHLIVEKRDTTKVYLDNNFSRFGITIGTPHFLMANYGYNNSKTYVGISIGYMGGQINYGLNVLTADSYEVNLLFNLNIRRYLLSTDHTDYMTGFIIGPLIDFYAAGFHLQTGIGYGIGKLNINQPFFHLGYAYRWRD